MSEKKECPGCKTIVDRLVVHHYIGENGKLKTWKICDVCNRVLSPHELWHTKGEQLHHLKEVYKTKSRAELSGALLDRWERIHLLMKRVKAWLDTRSDSQFIEKSVYELQSGLVNILDVTRDFRNAGFPIGLAAEFGASDDVVVLEKLRDGLIDYLCLTDKDPTFAEITQYFTHKKHRKEYGMLPVVKKKREVYNQKRYKEQQEIRAWIKAHPEEANRILEKSKS